MSKSALMKQFKSNTQAEKLGVLIEFGANEDGSVASIRVARSGGANTAYASRLEALLKPYRRQIQLDTMDKEKLEALVRQAFVETCVTEFNNVQEDDGSVVPFNTASVDEYLARMPELYKHLQEQANTFALYREHINEIAAGN